jgi:hypothetical protein
MDANTMTTQLELAPYQPHSPTSIAAAVAITPDTPTLRRQVLDYIVSQGQRGATDEQIQEALAMNPSTQRPRRIELVRDGLVRDSGTTRLTGSGRKAVVWTVTNQNALVL